MKHAFWNLKVTSPELLGCRQKEDTAENGWAEVRRDLRPGSGRCGGGFVFLSGEYRFRNRKCRIPVKSDTGTRYTGSKNTGRPKLRGLEVAGWVRWAAANVKREASSVAGWDFRPLRLPTPSIYTPFGM